MTDEPASPALRTVVVIGGAGVFGVRIVSGLCARGYDVVVAGRDLRRAEAVAKAQGCRAMQLDVTGPDVTARLAAYAPFAVIDAAGPFQGYGSYAVAEAALALKAHYLDLSDDAAFTSGIARFDADAKAAGVAVLSGVSSVPALSSAIVADLVTGLADVHLVESVILPGNRAPRGLSVIRAIVGQAGKPMRVWRGGVWSEETAWGWPVRRSLRVKDTAPVTGRWASFIGAPDLHLFPSHFRARSVLFRAGLESRLMHGGLVMLGWLARMIGFHRLEALSPALLWVAERLKGLGTDRGGMVVRVAGLDASGLAVDRVWTLIAEGGDGPHIPALPALILIGKLDHGEVPPGARACFAAFSRQEAEAALSTIRTACEMTEQPQPILFRDALGQGFAALPAVHRDLHTVIDRRVWQGKAEVTRGDGWIGRVLGAVIGLPASGANVPVTVTMQREGDTELWTRDFGGRRFSSWLSPRGGEGRLYERFGLLRFALRLEQVQHDVGPALRYAIEGADLLGIPLPRFLLPASETYEYVEDDKAHFDVTMSTPLTGLIVRYRGWLRDVAIPDHSFT